MLDINKEDVESILADMEAQWRPMMSSTKSKELLEFRRVDGVIQYRYTYRDEVKIVSSIDEI